MMNKINIESRIFLNDSTPYYLNIDRECKIEIIVSRDVNTKLIIIGYNNYDLDITVESQSNLVVNSLNNSNSVNVNVKLYQNSSITYNHSVLEKKDSINKFNILHMKNDSTSVLNNNGINTSNNKLFFIIDGVIPKNLSNISCSQNSKIINLLNGNSKIIPNLIIDSNDIVANHSAYVGKIEEEEKFYLASRGIDDEGIKKLIYKSVLLGKMELNEEKEEIKKVINEWW